MHSCCLSPSPRASWRPLGLPDGFYVLLNRSFAYSIGCLTKTTHPSQAVACRNCLRAVQQGALQRLVWHLWSASRYYFKCANCCCSSDLACFGQLAVKAVTLTAYQLINCCVCRPDEFRQPILAERLLTYMQARASWGSSGAYICNFIEDVLGPPWRTVQTAIPAAMLSRQPGAPRQSLQRVHSLTGPSTKCSQAPVLFLLHQIL